MNVIAPIIKRADELQVGDIIVLPGRYFSDDRSMLPAQVVVEKIDSGGPVLKTYGRRVLITHLYPGSEGIVSLTGLEDDEYFQCVLAEPES